jgi:hypothetical protein
MPLTRRKQYIDIGAVLGIPAIANVSERGKESVNTGQTRLAAEDGRHFAIDKVGTGLGMVATTERIGVVNVSFSLPSAPALFLNLAHKAFATYRDIEIATLFDPHPETGIWPENHKPLLDFCEQFAAHVVFAFTALESVANEVIANEVRAKGYTYTTTRSTKKGKPGEKVTYSGEALERHVALNEKLAEVLPDALGVRSPKGLALWRDYKSLKEWRDRIIHLKSADRQPRGPEIPSIWGDMLRHPKEPFCDNAHSLMGSYGPAITTRRWYQKYPYS